MTIIDFNSELERRIDHNAFDRCRVEFQRDGQGGRRLLDIGLNRPAYTLDESYTSLVGINDIDHTKTKVKHPQTNGICERFHKTIL